MRPLDKRIVGRLYPRYSTLLQALNENARFVRWAKEHEPSEVFAGRGSVERFYRYVNDAAAGTDAPIDFLEFGVATGRTLRLWTDINRHEDSRFYGFDSFQGLPEDWVWARGGMPRAPTRQGGGRRVSLTNASNASLVCSRSAFRRSCAATARRTD